MPRPNVESILLEVSTGSGSDRGFFHGRYMQLFVAMFKPCLRKIKTLDPAVQHRVSHSGSRTVGRDQRVCFNNRPSRKLRLAARTVKICAPLIKDKSNAR